ncbi:MAG: hypothetical protein M3010_12650 [Candidatus Dormibacteraeota bacterium]|nr:hypothetical protein [Candidatus Dormibacteraeota bacterium]
MATLIAVPLTCWLCVLIALPRRPLPGCEVQDLVYTWLLGRQRWLVLPTSYRSRPDGTWTLEELADGRWVVVATMSGPPAGVDPADDPASITRKR